ncbi:GABA permease [Clohesyomyces aquaticus]|uniref:GABA permease n=1 Tax=Clohesyomyces aquaticus TaxID=1231657 RepID=A0A1Y2A4K1_9PLEO|nr:GABA permease [Clohesyomyces aquaticus]
MEKFTALPAQEEFVAAESSPENDIKAGTLEDREAMKRLGKEQVFKRNFGFTSITGFAIVLMATWEVLLETVAFGLGNGGPSGLIYTYIGVWIGFILVTASMSEMASMAPTSGGQYHWTSEFSPRRYQKWISYLIGWLSILGYQVGVAFTAYLSGTIVQGLIVLNRPDYRYQRWHGTLIAMGFAIYSALFNIFFATWLPLAEILFGFIHFAAWPAILVTLWVLAPRSPSEQVWHSYHDAGWGNTGFACLVGLITSAGSFVGGDAPAHMAEEIKSASKVLPRTMMTTILVNGIMGFVTIVTFCYTMGDIDAAIASPTGYPIIQVFYGATGSVASATALSSFLVILNVAMLMTNTAGSSRQLFAFARDRGLPLSPLISRVPLGYDVPVNAIVLSTLLACVLLCINIGSTIGFQIITSIGTVSLLTSYMTSIGCVTWRRLRSLPLPKSHFDMGKLGVVVNLLSLAFLVFAFVFCFFPPVPNPAARGMNWAVAVYSGMLGAGVVYYLLRARHVYDGPVEYVRKSA